MITLIHPEIDPVILSFGNIAIRWYGLSYVIGFLLGYILIKKINKYLHEPLKEKIIEELFIWITLGVIIGGRIGYILFYQTDLLFYDPIKVFYVWQGGMSFHGGLIGVIISLIIFSNIKKVNFFILSDFVSTTVPIGIFFGRIANFINIELYGRTTSFYFAMIYPSIDMERRHPSQLYEAFFEGFVLFFLLFAIVRYNFERKKYGINSAIFLVIYGTFRFLLEFLREPDSHLGLFFNQMTMGQILCVPMILVGIIIYFQKNRTNEIK